MAGDGVIERLDISDRATAERLVEVQRLAYRQEADLIGFDGIPPLHETVEDLVAQPLEWRGIREAGRLVAAMAVTGRGRLCDIDRLVVDPAAQRRGHARRLVQSVLQHDVVTVSTGTANTPAVRLYESLGFRRTAVREIAPEVTVTAFERWNDRAATSFDADVALYARARPPYPAQLWERVLPSCAIGPGTRVLEIGPGTGVATLPLLDAGAEVVAVEPGGNMAAWLRERVVGRPCTVVHSRFEDADVDGAYDVAVAATSFHWLDLPIAMPKLARAVRPGGFLAVWWNIHGPPDGSFDEISHGVTSIAARYQTQDRREAIIPAFDAEKRRAELASGGWFDVVHEERMSWTWTHDRQSLRDLFASFSDWSTLPEPDRTRALDEVAALVDPIGPTVERTYSTQLYVGRRTGRSVTS